MQPKPRSAYLKCQHCGAEFRSPIQLPEGADVRLSNNTTNCPKCGKATSADRPFWKDDAQPN